MYFYCCELKGLNLSSMPSTLSDLLGTDSSPSVGLMLLFSFYNMQKNLSSRLWDLSEETSKEKQTNKQTKNYRAIPIQKPAFNKEISCHFFISKCTWCANANVRIACSINHNRKQYKFTIPECKDQSEKDKNRLFFSKSEGLPSQLCWNRRERTDLLVHKHGHSYAGLCNVK